MDDFDDFLDIDGDGDDAVEMCLFFDEDSKKKGNGLPPSGSSGCCVVFLILGAEMSMMAWGISKIFS